ncbi:MAG: STAS domain-containing protein [Planctomycetes bacterium]|nr:STAS domain-containing protein [Planctomycetota bacterium]
MNITAESYGRTVLLNLPGELTEDSIAAFLQAVDHQLLAEEVVDIVLNMENVPFVDSAALECLLDLNDRLAEKLGQVKLAAVSETVWTILEVTRMDSTFEIYTSVPEAVRAVHA